MAEDTTKKKTTKKAEKKILIGDHNDVEITGHQFTENKLKIDIEGPTMSRLEAADVKKAVYAYRHEIGGSNMGLNKFEPQGLAADVKKGSMTARGSWYLMAGL